MCRLATNLTLSRINPHQKAFTDPRSRYTACRKQTQLTNKRMRMTSKTLLVINTAIIGLSHSNDDKRIIKQDEFREQEKKAYSSQLFNP